MIYACAAAAERKALPSKASATKLMKNRGRKITAAHGTAAP
jgi:hypothetical protein